MTREEKQRLLQGIGQADKSCAAAHGGAVRAFDRWQAGTAQSLPGTKYLQDTVVASQFRIRS